MLDGLVAVGIVAHVHHGHLADFVDREAVIAVVIERRNGKYGVEHGVHSVRAAHESGQPVRVVKHRPCVVPRVAFREVAAPFQRRERQSERSVGATAAHERCRWEENIAVVAGTAGIRLQFAGGAAESESKTVDAPVVVGILQRAGHAFIDANIARHVAQTVIVVETETARGAHRRMLGIGPVDDTLPERGGIGDAYAFDPRVGQNRCGVVAHHAVAVARAAPFGEKSALAVGVKETFLHFQTDRRIEEVEQREEGAECVPDAGIGIEVAGHYASVIGTIVHRVACGIHLVEFAGEECGAVETGVERAQLVGVGSLGVDLHTAEHVVPCVAAGGTHGVEVNSGHFAEIDNGLLLAYKRRGHSGRDLLSALCAESDHGSGMFAGIGQRVGVQFLSVGGGHIVGVAVELHHEIVGEIVGHTAAVARGASYDTASGNAHFRAVVERIDHHKRLSFGEGEPHDGCAVGGCHLGNDIVVGEIHLIIIWRDRLGLMREPARAAVLIEYRSAGDGHQRELAVVVDPRAGLMGLLEAADTFVGVGILPSVAHLAGLGCPEIHAPRARYGRIGVAGRQVKSGHGAHERADIVSRICCCGGYGPQQKKSKYSFGEFHGLKAS